MTPTTIDDYTTTASPSENLPVSVLVVVGYLSVLAAVGSAGNALVLCVFSKKKDKLTSTLFIIALAAVDFITCVVVMPFTIYMEYVDFHVSSDVCCKLYQFLITCNIPFSALVMVAIAVDRYLCICHPFVRVLTLDRAKVLIGFLAAVAASLGACVAMFYGVYRRPEAAAVGASNATEPSAVGVVTVPLDDYITTTAAAVDTDNDDGLINIGKCEENDLILGKDFQWYYQKLYNFMYPVCLLAVVVLYVLIYRSVLRRRYKRQREKRKTLALVKTAQQTEQRQRELETPSPERSRRAPMVELAVDVKATTDVSAFDDSTLATDINGCLTLLPVSLLYL